jgi:hypothetical protein
MEDSPRVWEKNWEIEGQEIKRNDGGRGNYMGCIGKMRIDIKR